jgi:hypothetical protein
MEHGGLNDLEKPKNNENTKKAPNKEKANLIENRENLYNE